MNLYQGLKFSSLTPKFIWACELIYNLVMKFCVLTLRAEDTFES